MPTLYEFNKFKFLAFENGTTVDVGNYQANLNNGNYSITVCVLAFMDAVNWMVKIQTIYKCMLEVDDIAILKYVCRGIYKFICPDFTFKIVLWECDRQKLIFRLAHGNKYIPMDVYPNTNFNYLKTELLAQIHALMYDQNAG